MRIGRTGYSSMRALTCRFLSPSLSLLVIFPPHRHHNYPHLYRLHIQRFPSSMSVDDMRSSCRPGCMGPCLYTLRCFDATELHQTIADSAASGVSTIVCNEFGEQSFSFTSPDGYFWTMLAQ